MYCKNLRNGFGRVQHFCSPKLSTVYDTNIKSVILGIETSCDDTGCAIVDNAGNILGEALHSQQQIHLEHGGIIPPLARDLHEKNIKQVVDSALASARMQLSDMDAIATTVKPGLPLSLAVGMKYGKYLSTLSKKPFIPIDHMEAHALTIRMVQRVDFPFLVLLISGGHCLLAVAQAVNKFLLLGQSLDDAPGECFEKIARRLKLRNLPEYRTCNGGAMLEKAAEKGDPSAFEIGIPLLKYRDCNFSMAGIKNAARRIIIQLEQQHNIEGDQILCEVFDVASSVQHAVAKHICDRVQRGIEYVRQNNMIPEDNSQLVVSGGVACNTYIQRALQIVCDTTGYKLCVPPPHLCTDNGVMIAWNGVERWQASEGIYSYSRLSEIDIEKNCEFGEDWSQAVTAASIKCKWIKLDKLLQQKGTGIVTG